MRCVSPARCAPVHSTSGSSRSAHCEQIPSHILFHGRDNNKNNNNNSSGLPLTGGGAAVYWSRWKWLSDFAQSLPGQVWGHCGPPSLWTTVTWLRQQSAQWNSGAGGTSWKLLAVHPGIPSPSSLHFPRVFFLYSSHTDSCPGAYCCELTEKTKQTNKTKKEQSHSWELSLTLPMPPADRINKFKVHIVIYIKMISVLLRKKKTIFMSALFLYLLRCLI